jgi:hypothetical protein
MAKTPDRLVGPQQVATGPTTVFTSPAGGSLARWVRVSNPSGSPVEFTLSVGADAASTRVYYTVDVAPGQPFFDYPYLELDEGEILQASADTNNVLVLTVGGDLLSGSSGGGSGDLTPLIGSGRYFGNGNPSQNSNSNGGAEANAIAVPLLLPRSGTLDRIGIIVPTGGAGSAGALLRLGLYDFGAGYPGALILDAGTVDGSTDGQKFITISQAVTAGWIFAVVAWQGAPASRALINGITPNTHLFGMSAVALGDDTWEGGGFLKASVSGALPDPFGGTETVQVNNLPRVAVRYSSVSGGGGGTPTLSQVLTAGNDAGSQDITGVGNILPDTSADGILYNDVDDKNLILNYDDGLQLYKQGTGAYEVDVGHFGFFSQSNGVRCFEADAGAGATVALDAGTLPITNLAQAASTGEAVALDADALRLLAVTAGIYVVDYGFLPSGALAQTVTRTDANVDIDILSSGRLELHAINLVEGVELNNITYFSGTQAGANLTHQLFGIFDDSAGTTSGTPYALLRGSADDGSTAWGANTAKTLALTSPYTPTRSGFFYLGVLVSNSSGNLPYLIGTSAGSNKTIVMALDPVVAGFSTSSITALPNPAAAPTARSVNAYAYVS